MRPREMTCALGLLLAALALEPIGDLTEQEFLVMLDHLGFKAGLHTPSGAMRVSAAEGEFVLQLGFTKSPSRQQSIVGSARGLVVYDLPRALPPRQLTSWLSQGAYQGVTAVTLLSGKVRFEVWLATPSSTHQEVVAKARLLLKAGRQFKAEFAGLGAKEADPYRPGPAKYDPEAVMSPIQLEDTDFIAAHFGWDKIDKPLALRQRGTLVQVEGIVFSVHLNSPEILLIASFTPDPKKVERHLRNQPTIKWAEATIEPGHASISYRHKVEGEIMAKEVACIIEQFGRNIKALDLL